MPMQQQIGRYHALIRVTFIPEQDTLLVEFSDDQGSASAIASCTPSDLLVLHHALEAA